MSAILENLKEFHGHLAPYVVIGYKMGLIATKELNGSHKNLTADVKTGTKPPISCIIDGIQFSSGCTLGKGNINVFDEKKAEAIFNNGKQKIKIELKEEIQKHIKEKLTKENEEELAFWIYNLNNKKLFDTIKTGV